VGTRSSWRGTAVEFREALREVLDQLAPDAEVEAQSNFKREPDTKGTMKQKAVFMLRARRTKKAQVKTFAEAFDVVDGLIGNLARSVYTRSSVAVHVADSREEARKVRDYVSLVLAELLEIGD
jgi:predicted pPIWI-associating nuclease